LKKEYFFLEEKPRYGSGWVFRKHAGLKHPVPCLAEAEWQENRLKAERARFLDRRERRAKPETEPLLARWDKSGVFSKHSAGAIQTVFLTPSLSLFLSKI
jgi:hypothetical protein